MRYIEPTGHALSDIGVVRTNDPGYALSLQQHSDAEYQRLREEENLNDAIPQEFCTLMGCGASVEEQGQPQNQPLTSVSVLGNSMNINYAEKVSADDRLAASDSIFLGRLKGQRFLPQTLRTRSPKPKLNTGFTADQWTSKDNFVR